jgi:hypothetical protein
MMTAEARPSGAISYSLVLISRRLLLLVGRASVLGHASAGFSLTQYGHIFDADLDRVADRLDALLDPETGQGRDKAGSTLVQLPTRKS